MSYGKKLDKAGCKGETPPGKESYRGFRNEIKGFLEYTLSHLSIEEFIDILDKILAEERDYKTSWELNFDPEDAETRKLLRERLQNRKEKIDETLKEFEEVTRNDS